MVRVLPGRTRPVRQASDRQSGEGAFGTTGSADMRIAAALLPAPAAAGCTPFAKWSAIGAGIEAVTAILDTGPPAREGQDEPEAGGE